MKDSLGNRVRIIRLLKGLSQQHMAKQMNITQKTYSLFESGKKKFVQEDLEKIASIFKIEIGSILYFSPERVLQSMESPYNRLHKFNPDYQKTLKKLRAEKQEEIAYYKMRLEMMEKGQYVL